LAISLRILFARRDFAVFSIIFDENGEPLGGNHDKKGIKNGKIMEIFLTDSSIS
jgi:hypothetical protein